jgi:hypothetical protein
LSVSWDRKFDRWWSGWTACAGANVVVLSNRSHF